MNNYNPQSKTFFIRKKEYSPRYVIALARNLRNNMTDAEKILWEKISKRKIDGLRFRKQHSIGRYIVDFYCFEKKLVIELDGDIHDSQKEYDHNRDNELTARGNTILRFKNEEVINNIDYVLSRIVETCKNIAESPPKSADCTIGGL
jgi:very-short-patch-repair endonuclease